jgi:hypothetical protein
MIPSQDGGITLPNTRVKMLKLIYDRWSWYGTPSLTGGWVCNLLIQLLLGLAEQSILGSSAVGLTSIFYSHMRLPQPGEQGPHIYIPQEQGSPVIPLGTNKSNENTMYSHQHVTIWFERKGTTTTLVKLKESLVLLMNNQCNWVVTQSLNMAVINGY